MDATEIVPGGIYRGGKDGHLREVIGFGASKDWIVWGYRNARLVYGGYVHTKCTGRKSFAKWALERVPDPYPPKPDPFERPAI